MPPSYCPHCGTAAPEGARFCMKCGREQPTAAGAGDPVPPALPPMGPPPGHAHRPAPPGYAPVRPSPAGEFLGRAMRGDWAGSLKAAAWPTGLILALAVALAIPSYGQGDDVVVGWSDRLRIALAMLLQAFGGGFEVRAAGPGSPYGSGSDGSGGSDAFGAGYGTAGQAGATLSLVPLTVTVLWVGALLLAARAARKQGGGMEAAVRISALVTGAILVLGLFAQPDIAGVSVSSSPLLAALGALVLSLLVTGGVLQQDAAAQWLAQRPAAHAVVRATGTAVRALGAVIALCALIGFIAYANVDGVDGTAMLLTLPVLPNIGLAVLGVSWGAPVEYDVRGEFGWFGSGMEHGGFGLSELGDAVDGWAVAGAVLIGVVCALYVGVSAARRSVDRREQAIAGGLFLVLYLLPTGLSGVSAELSGDVAGVGGQGMAEIAPSVPDALLFGLLWVGGAVLVAPHLLRLVGRPAGTTAPAPAWGPGTQPRPPVWTPPAQTPPTTVPTATPQPTPYPPYDPRTVHLGPAAAATAAAATAARRRSVVVWSVTLVAAVVLGGGITAGVLFLKSDKSDSRQPPAAAAEDNKPAASGSSESAPPEAGPTPSPTPVPTTSPTASATAPPAAPTVPGGYRMVSDSAGFSFAVPVQWDRESERNHQITYAGSTGRAELKVGVIRNAPYTSYENFRNLERTADANQKNYRRLQLGANTFQGFQGAIWEYTYEDKQSGETIHAIDQSYIADDGTEYAIYTTERDRYWSDARQIFDTALSTWMLNDLD
ncbi:zinc ribbon domain-containing protein [Streptomyces sp. NRRL S-1824]|uniref:zinc ribbon domain-containing protein n=1 Tax=Streptomyces sp. NRRL S-1824 TaxID=1463889 RepID=UPI0018FFC42D|nr:zinc ribbon domain-containing protein [Streptomyces sp. NRRL S-1824]